MPADRSPRSPWWANPVYRQLAAENADLRAENDRLRALLTPPLGFPAKWRLSPQEAALLSALYAQAGCVSHQRLAAALAGPDGVPSRKQIHVVLCRIRQRTSRYGVEIEAYHGLGYGLTIEGRAMVRVAVEAIERMRVAA